MDSEKLKKGNIDNLTTLWKKMGAKAQVTTAQVVYYLASRWPNRCWFDWDTDFISGINSVLDVLRPDQIVPVWDKSGNKIGKREQDLIDNGFGIMLEQTAMVLSANDFPKQDSSVNNIKLVSSTEDIESWVSVGSKAFGYQIDPHVISKLVSDDDIKLFIYYCENTPAGTALLCKTSEVIGVHQVGVAPAFQGKRIGSSLMKYLIPVCKEWQGEFITLQASAAGKGLYERLGFKPQFMIRSYRRK
ncbi:GNAT family N-acetyltransferase [Desulfovibrio gilichinskyi]|uniref:Acetyltransferase (GNAT) domain-containing protein n=1 Tax=Desulfovibrio gilichinskyi TaxID=1519643 RepID=A0A1X7CU29_9BACT|nr:GNAT family N-acetyltransferase [Desulfovibrio gilichinskyi]SMF03101.1 Acetyltransferase (GNAT) domain-containing protein [Desulfovibrio gilichinskyi]